MSEITYTTEILDKEGIDFKIEIGRNKDNDKIIRILSKETGEKEYTLVVETLALNWNYEKD